MIGINVDGNGRVSPGDLIRIGARVARCDTYPDVDLTRWVRDMQAAGIVVCLVLGSSALTHDPMNWPGRLHQVKRRYGGRGVRFQIGNEPDAGWSPGMPSDWHLDQRRRAHSSSWIQSYADYQYLLECAGTELEGEYLIGAGLCSGHPEWATNIYWHPYVKNLAFHPYAKEPNTPELDNLILGYCDIDPGSPLWATETHAKTPGLAAYLNIHPNISKVIPFCYTDQMVVGFGLIEDRDALADYLVATRPGTLEPPELPEPPEPVVNPWPNYWIGNGLRQAILARGEIPIGPEVGGMQMAPTEQALYVYVPSTDKVMRIPWERV